jgi:large subunit ribosomal protein L3
MKVAIGTKKGMTRVFRDEKSVPVTVVDLSGCVVALKDTRGVELGLDQKRGNKAIEGKYKELGYVPKFTQFFTGEVDGEVGEEVKAESFAVGTKVKISATAKGKGFQGVVKRWGFKGGQRTHGQSDRQRAPGSIGAGTDPGRVLKGKKMAGRMGGNTVTLKGKEIVDIIDNYLLISGPIPGNRGGVVVIEIEK